MSSLISKQKAIEAIREFQGQVTCDFSQDWEDGMNEGFDQAVGVIELMGTVEAEPVRHGKWNETNFMKVRECSCCHAQWGIYSIEEFDYCPSCGAKMDEVEE